MADVVVASPEDISLSVNNNVSKPEVEVAATQPAADIPVVKKPIDDLWSASKTYTTKRDEAVKLRTDDSGPAAMKPVTIQTVFKNTLQKSAGAEALAVQRNGRWVKWTYQQYYNDVIKTAKAFIKLGLEPYHGVGILGFNAPEWFFADLGAIFAGGFATGIYTTNTAEACEYVLSNCQANVVVVEDHQQLKKILKVWDNLPDLKAVVQYTGEVAERTRENIYSWSEFMELAKDVDDESLERRTYLQAPNKACTLIYTSGTTGNPKGVMLSHDNLTWTAKYIGRYENAEYGSEVIVSYLPLSHIAGQMLDMQLPLAYGAAVYFANRDALKLTYTASVAGDVQNFSLGDENVFVSYLPLSHVAAQINDLHVPLRFASFVYFAEPNALKGSLNNTLKEVRPTVLLGVPRVWEKIMEKMQETSRQVKGLKKMFGAWAKRKGKEGVIAKMEGRPLPFLWGVANSFLFQSVKKSLGLDRCKLCISGAAPIMRETLEFFYTFDIALQETYGMSESTGPHCIGSPENFRLCSVGKELPGIRTKLADQDEEGNGEICMFGRHVCMGYLNNEEKTEEIFDKEGWLLSGDIGKKDKDGFLYITGRKKELIITAGGENIAPVPIEDSVKEALPCLSNCMLIGDKRKFLSMILTLKVGVDPDTGEPSENLSREAREWCQSVNSTAVSVSDIVDKQDKHVLNAIQAGIDTANAKAVSRATKVQKWSILPTDFSIPGGELGPTLKLRRPIVVKKYSKTIETLYAET